jgi:hypothetical protein
MPLQIKPNPTFKCKVGIPVPGADKMEVEFEFRHMRKAQFVEFVKSGDLDKLSDVEVVLKLATGWNLPVEFNESNLDDFLQDYHGAAQAIWLKYGAELTGARLGN